MSEDVTPRIVISACIEHAACRWNGLIIRSDAVKIMKPFVEFLAVCPEMECGLGTPRDPVRIVEKRGVRRLVQPASGLDVTERMQDVTRRLLDSADGAVDGFVLKSRSPSCGMFGVSLYPSPEAKGAVGTGPGFFGGAVTERFADLPAEEEGRLRNFTLREEFFTRIWTLARFRAVRRAGSAGALVDFQARHKYLLQSYSEKDMRALGRIVADQAKRPLSEVLAGYEKRLRAALQSPPDVGGNVNVLTHAMGFFKDKVSAAEKRFFLNELEQYRRGRLPLGAVAGVLRAWIVRFDEKYLAQQYYFSPFPDDLVSVSDSGTGRKLR